MKHHIGPGEFEATARKVERQLSIWRGEWVRSGIEDEGKRRAAQALMEPAKINALKRGLRGRCLPDGSAAWVLDPLIPHTWDLTSQEYIAIYQMALLYTIHPHSTRFKENDDSRRRQSLAKAAASANGHGAAGDREESDAQNRRINDIIHASRGEIVPYLARRLGRLMNGTEVPIDWVQIAKDLRDWSEPRREVQTRWGQDWYGGPAFMRGRDEAGDQESAAVAE